MTSEGRYAIGMQVSSGHREALKVAYPIAPQTSKQVSDVQNWRIGWYANEFGSIRFVIRNYASGKQTSQVSSPNSRSRSRTGDIAVGFDTHRCV